MAVSTLGNKNKRKKWVRYTSFGKIGEKNSEHTLCATGLRNCEGVNGVLRAGVGFEPIANKANVPYVWDQNFGDPDFILLLNRWQGSEQEKTICCLMSDGKMREYFDTDGIFSYKYHVFSQSIAVPGYDAENKQTIYCIGAGGIYAYQKTSCNQLVTKKFLLPVGCFVQGRLFCAEREGLVVYYAPFDMRNRSENIEDCGSVRLPSEAGEIVAMAAINSCAYIFCEYGVFRLKVAASARDFNLQQIEYTGGLIFGKSVCAFAYGEERILFMTINGLFALQKDKITHVSKFAGNRPALQQTNCKSVHFDGKYFVQYTDIDGNDCAYTIDLASGWMYESPDCIAPSNTLVGALCIQNGVISRMRANMPSESTTALFVAQNVDFGFGGRKCLKKLYVKGKGTIAMRINNDAQTLEYVAEEIDGVKEYTVLLAGDKFTLQFQMKGDTYMEEVRAELLIDE